MSNFLKSNKILIAILIFAAFLRFYRLDYPNAYVFDEVYHGFTAKEYLKGSKEAWEWWTTPPPGVAFEWTHPTLAKEIMTSSMYILGFFNEYPGQNTEAFGWRLPGSILGVISVFLVYLLGKKLFGRNSGLIAAFIFSIDGLNFVQSRTGMNDIYLVTFSLASVLFLLNKKFFFSALFLGLAFASKWSAAYLLGINGLLLFYFLLNRKIKFAEFSKTLAYFILIVPAVYLISYIPFFSLSHTTDQFVELQRQIWWYHSNLKATHDYSSPAWSWPLNLYPVWYFVEYHKNGLVSNIFASGNPVLFWLGVGAIFISIYDLFLAFAKKNSFLQNSHEIQEHSTGIHLSLKDSYVVVLLGFFGFWLPWIFSPRIMFLYHYSPSVPFLCIALAFQIKLIMQQRNSKYLGFIILGLILIGFLIVYPVLTGIPLQKDLFMKFFDINLSKNPFAG